MNTRTQVLAVAAVVNAHRRIGSRSCGWVSSAVPSIELALAMSQRGGDRGTPDFMRR